jgi:YfiH family protein
MIVKEGPTGVYRLESFGRGVVAGFHSRIFDHSRRGEFLHKLGLFPDNLVMVKQVHGSTIVVAERPDPELLEIPADGLITKIPGLVLGIRTADCVPVFFWDPVRKVAGIVHAGWKGVKDGIIAQMLKIFEKKCGTKMGDLRVAIGPRSANAAMRWARNSLVISQVFITARTPPWVIWILWE